MIRIGLHRMSGRADGLFRDYVERVRPNVVKFLDPGPGDEALAAWCRSLGVEVIGRVYFDPQELGAGGGRQIARVLAAARACPSIRYWELHNEAWQAGEELARYAELSLDFMRQIDALGGGRKAVIGSFSVGMPALEDWVRYRPALEYAAAHGHLLGLHQYGGGSKGMKFDPAWFSLRHRQVIAWARAAGVRMPGIVITEGGIDSLDQADIKTRGWKTMPAGYDYAADLAWWCTELSLDPLVVGAVDFGFGTADPQWSGFDLADRPDVLERLIAQMRALPVATPPAPKPPKEGPAMDFIDHLTRHLGGRLVDQRAALPDLDSPRYGRFGKRLLSTLDTIAVHHTAGGKDQTPQQVYAFHTGPERQWSGIGYHLLIRRGQVHYVGDVLTARACVGDLNPRVVCVCLTGDYTKETVDAADLDALRLTVAALQAWAGASLGRRLAVKGHGELPGQTTACPGQNLLPIVHQLAAGTAPAPAPQPTPGGLRFDKVVFQLEEADRRLQAEGLKAEAAFVAANYTAAAIKRRDGR